jgi:tRNA A-37 threonylcarbamoyl transferase component Bud32
VADPADDDERSATRTASPSVRVLCDEPLPPIRLEPGAWIDRYRVIEFLGEGGMGKVYRARDTELDRDVALKWIDPKRFGAPRAQFLLRREAQAMARVEHPAVVRIYDVGVAREHLFVAMELVRGGALGAWMRAQRRSWRDVLRVFGEAGRGIAAAHRAGLVHRDIKPSNILLDDEGRPRISDFGLARMLDDRESDEPASGAPDPSVTQTGAVVGTPAYMAPEQLAGDAVDARADQFAFCVALWEALCGARPFRLDGVAPVSLRARLAAIRAGAIERPPRDARVPRRLLAVLRRGLAGDRAGRWSSMDALLDALDHAARPRGRWLIAGAAAAIAATALAWLAVRDVGDVEPVPLATPRPVARADHEGVAVTMLRDGRFVRLDGGELAIITGDNLARRALPMPPGAAPAWLRASAVDGWLEIGLEGPTCSWWHAPVDGGAWQLLVDDPRCSRMVSVRPDGAALAIVDNDELRIRDRATGAERVVAGSASNRFAPVWSLDGARLAAHVHERLIVLDAATGAIVVGPRDASDAQWLDHDRLLYIGNTTWTRSELRVLDVRSGADRLVREIDGDGRGLAVGRDGLLIYRAVMQGQAYATAMPPPHPMTVDELTPLDTGAEIDFFPVSWTSDGALITVAVTFGRRGLVRTVPGTRGAPLIAHRSDQIMLGGANRGQVIYMLGEGSRCTLRVHDIATGRDIAVDDRPCSERQFARCATQAPRCIAVTGNASRWLDTTSATFSGAAPELSLGDELSPDASELLRIRDNAIVVRNLATGATTTIALSPPVAGIARVRCANDPDTLLVEAYEPGHERVLIATRDGHWRAIIDEPDRSINSAVLSPDGRKLGLVAVRIERLWSYLPFASPDARDAP